MGLTPGNYAVLRKTGVQLYTEGLLITKTFKKPVIKVMSITRRHSLGNQMRVILHDCISTHID